MYDTHISRLRSRITLCCKGRDRKMRTVYLSGPIMDEHEGVARKWRDIAESLLSSHFRLLDPMRRNFRDKEVDSANEIVEFDLQDIRDADIVLVNYRKPSIGTSMEVFYASHDLGKFVVAFSPFSFKDCSPWMVRYCTKILPSLEEACKYLKTHFTDIS
jgi:hypothetical protein